MRDHNHRPDSRGKVPWLLVTLIASATCSCAGYAMARPPMAISVSSLNQSFSPDSNVGIQVCFNGFVSGVRIALYRSVTDHSNPIYEHIHHPSDISGHEAVWQTGHCETFFVDLAKLDLRAGTYGLEVQPCASASESAGSCSGPAPKKRELMIE